MPQGKNNINGTIFHFAIVNLTYITLQGNFPLGLIATKCANFTCRVTARYWKFHLQYVNVHVVPSSGQLHALKVSRDIVQSLSN